ncbi:MAG: response regulator, partial [bacterium]
MTKTIRILHLEDSAYDAELIHSLLKKADISCDIVRVIGRDEFISKLDEGLYDLILSDYSLPGFDGLSALKIAKDKMPDIPFIFISAAIGEERAIDSLKHGATDYVLKQRLSRLTPVIRRTLQEAQERTELRLAEKALKENQERFRSIVESSQEWIWEIDPAGHLT